LAAPVGIHRVEQFRGSLHGAVLFFPTRTENAANHLGDHALSVRANDADRNPVPRHKRLAVASTEILLGNPFIDPVSLAIVMSMQSDLVIPG
jgi:hypothetical protein